MTTNPPEIPPESRRPTERADATSETVNATTDVAEAPAETVRTSADANTDTGTKTKTVLTPEEVSLESDDVAPLGDNRYLVRAERGPESDREAAAPESEADDGNRADEPQGPNYARVLAAAPEPHGVDLTLKTDGEIAHHRVMSNDVREVFVEMLTWYASQLDEDLTPGEALQVMLAATDLEVGTD